MAEDGAFRAVVEGLIEGLPAEGVAMPAEVVSYGKRERVLPVTWDMAGIYVLHPEGGIGEIDWDHLTFAPSENKDPVVRNRALFQGARKFAALAPFVPQRPANAITCPHCDGTGTPQHVPTSARGRLICLCGGVGWLPPTLPGGPPHGRGIPIIALEAGPRRMLEEDSTRLPAEDVALDDDSGVSPAHPYREGPVAKAAFRFFFIPLMAIAPLGGVAFVMWLVREARQGRGGELYRTGWGYKFNPIGGLVLLAAIVAVTVLGGIVRWWLTRDERKFDRQYPERRD
jgi:hypothetical protein